MDPDEAFSQEERESGSDELLSDDHLRLPEGASMLVRLHAVRSWLTRRQQETNIEIGEAALILQAVTQEEPAQTRIRRREHLHLMERIQKAQQVLQTAQERLHTYEEAQALLEECVAHTTTGERMLVEYYLTLEDLVQNELEEEDTSSSSRLQALAEVQHRVEHVSSFIEE
jgi:DNA primase